MTVTYDEEVDVLTITLSGAAVADSDEVRPGVILDYDAAGNTVGIELLDASRRTDSPLSVSYKYERMGAARGDTERTEAVRLAAV